MLPRLLVAVAVLALAMALALADAEGGGVLHTYIHAYIRTRTAGRSRPLGLGLDLASWAGLRVLCCAVGRCGMYLGLGGRFACMRWCLLVVMVVVGRGWRGRSRCR